MRAPGAPVRDRRPGDIRDAISWLEDPAGVDREVLVLEDSGEIVGIVMHEDDDGDRFINALAIRSDQQAKGLGRLVLGTVLDDLVQRFAGQVATWLVAPANFASHAMSEAVGADVTYPPETKPNALYAIALFKTRATASPRPR
jgi:acetyltransferase (GNAT) family protein